MNDRIEVLLSRDDPAISSADIVTNLGHIRPLDKLFLNRLKGTVAIPLMFESWEFRAEDIDLREYRRIGIPVLATNEEHFFLQTTRYLGHLVFKLLLELEIEVFKSDVLVWGSGKFGTTVSDTLVKAGARVNYLEIGRRDEIASKKSKNLIKACDAVVLAEHIYRDQLIGPQGPISYSFDRVDVLEY